MAITDNEYDELVMSLVVEGGNARSLAMEAIQKAKAGDFEGAEALLEECGQALVEAHKSQTEMIQSEINGNRVEVRLLMVHAQDHLMDAMVVKDMAQEFVDLYKTVKNG